MKIQGKTKNFEIVNCNNFKKRFLGNMGKQKIEEVLLFPNCNSIHTFFMRTKIDVVMLSKENIVLFIYPSLSKWKIIFPKKKVYSTLEFPMGENIYQIGDKVEYKQ